MLVVLASGRDLVANALVHRWRAHDARLLTPDDLAAPDWSFDPLAPLASMAVIAGDVIPFDCISGVLTRLPGVGERPLPSIVPADRSYVAAEMTAFLHAWLAALTCPVLNHPSPACLAGPGWWPEQWLAATAGLGLPVRSLHRRATVTGGCALAPDAPAAVTTTVVGDRCFGMAPGHLERRARRLAATAGVDLLTVRFNGTRAKVAVVAADPWPDLAEPVVADAVLARLTGTRPP